MGRVGRRRARWARLSRPGRAGLVAAALVAGAVGAGAAVDAAAGRATTGGSGARGAAIPPRKVEVARRWRTRAIAMWAVLSAGVAGGIAHMLLTPSSASASDSTPAGDPRLAEMASPSPFRGLVFTGLSLGKDG